ncbi:MAG: hypothetical protein V7K75_17880 [Nostoc sp.]
MQSNNLMTWMLAKFLCASPPALIDFKGSDTRFKKNLFYLRSPENQQIMLRCQGYLPNDE